MKRDLTATPRGATNLSPNSYKLSAKSFFLIPFATHAFVFQRQECTSLLPSLSVFPMISTDFTPTP